MRLQMEIGRHLFRIVDQDIVHRHIRRPQVFGALDDFYLWKILAQTLHDWLGVRIDNNLIDFRHGKQGFENMMEEGSSGKKAVVLAGHALTVMTHWDESNNIHKG